jgi:hypothetical protein
MDAPAFFAFPEAQLQEKQGKWELPQTAFTEASEGIARDDNFREN